MEAEQYILSNYVAADELRTSWNALTTSDKEALLNRAHKDIDMLPFQGCKTNESQLTSFPRYPKTVVPTLIKNAQVEQALTLATSATSSEVSTYEKMWTYGVQSYSIGNLSESFGEVAGGGSLAREYGIISVKAQRLLKTFLGGGYNL